MKKVVFVVSGGELGDPLFFREQAVAVAATVICADGGARHLQGEGVLPALIIGDMDSLDAAIERDYRAKGCRIVRYPQQKDETDTALALREAFGMAPAEIWIWGAMGRRVDHTLANVFLLLQGVARGIAVKLIDSWCEVFLITGRKIIQGEAGQTVSLFPLGGEVSGVTLTGFEYPLAKATLAVGHPRGISNRLTGTRGIVEVAAGSLLAVRYFQPGRFPGEEKG